MAKDYNKYFDAHPGVDKFFFTSDGMAFFKKPDAEAHARTLPDKKVEEKNRVAAPVIGLNDASESSAKKGGKKGTPKAGSDKEPVVNGGDNSSDEDEK